MFVLVGQVLWLVVVVGWERGGDCFGFRLLLLLLAALACTLPRNAEWVRVCLFFLRSQRQRPSFCRPVFGGSLNVNLGHALTASSALCEWMFQALNFL